MSTPTRGPDWKIRELLDAHAENERFAPEVFAAVRAVLDLHKPDRRVVDPWTRCTHCQDSNGDREPWPCDTVEAIDKALEVK